jgi:hypothetical protein
MTRYLPPFRVSFGPVSEITTLLLRRPSLSLLIAIDPTHKGSGSSGLLPLLTQPSPPDKTKNNEAPQAKSPPAP